MHRFILRILSLVIVGTFVVSSITGGAENVPIARANDRIEHLDTLRTDMAAHALGTEYHGQNTPLVAHFGTNTTPSQPLSSIDGMDQWLAQQGVLDPSLQRNSRAALTGTKKYLVMRVYFNDKTATSYYGKDASDTSGTSGMSVEEDLLKPLKTFWELTSYGKVTIDWDITDLYQLPKNRNWYIKDESGGDLSSGCADPAGTDPCMSKFARAVSDAVANIPDQASYDFNEYDGVLVLMAETDASQFHRGQASQKSTSWTGYALPGVPSGTMYGTVVMSENPSKRARETYGRMGHEFGHAFQVAGPAHPSDYQNEFELMDSNYPGQTGAYQKQDHVAFPGWMPTNHYMTIKNSKSSQTDMTCIRALEYDPASQPNMQVIKVEITADVYYLLSVRNRILGDDLNDDTHPTYGIPTEGLLIERVDESRTDYEELADGTIVDEKIVDVIYPKNEGLKNRNQLWRKPITPETSIIVDKNTVGNSVDAGGDVSSLLTNDDVTFYILPESPTNPNKDYYCVRVQYGAGANQPDVSMRPWRESPGNRYETTDIWFDSPLNGYGTYRYGTWNDMWNNPVPRYNGDIPAVGSVNRFYARVRNTGTKNATNVVVHFDVTDPTGLGIAGSEGWSEIASVDKTAFPALASIAPNSYVDVYIDWTPDITLTQEQIDAGEFQFHTCTRVRIDPVAGEFITGNQDGQMEQENVTWFEATPEPVPGLEFVRSFNLHNTSNSVITYTLGLENQLPPGWDILINNGTQDVEVAPQTSEVITVTIVPTGTAVIGSIFDIKINAKFAVTLEDELADITDIASRYHGGMIEQGGISFNVNVLAPTDISCDAYGRGTYINVIGALDGFEGIHQAGVPLRAYAQVYDNNKNPIPLDDRASADVGANGVFRANFTAVSQEDKGVPDAKFVRCIFPGTHMLASSITDFIPIINDIAPTSTTEPWVGSQFHFNLNRNEFLVPLDTYSAQPQIVPIGVDTFGCTLPACPRPIGGVLGRGIEFDARNTSHLYSNTAYRLNRTFSVAMWFRRTQINTHEILLSHGNTFQMGRLFTVGINSDNQLYCGTYDDDIVSISTITDTDWHHITCAVDGANRRLYLDGIREVNSVSGKVNNYNEFAPVVLARRADLGNSFWGSIDDVRIYTQFLDSTTVDALAGAKEPSLFAQKHLTFDDLDLTHNGVLASCGGGGCPIVTYPERGVEPRPLERVAAIRMQTNRAIALSSMSAIPRTTDSTLLFWARLDGSGTLVVEPISNGGSIGWDSESRTLSYATLSYTWDDEDGDPSTWHFFAFVKSGGTLTLLIDGNQVQLAMAPATLLPFRVGTRRTVYVGNANGGELAAIELNQIALSNDEITRRYSTGIPSAHVTPTRSLTPSPTPSPSAVPAITNTPTRTFAAKDWILQTKAALQTNVAATKQALPRTQTVVSASTKVAAAATAFWNGVDKTNTAVKLNTPTSNRVPISFTTVKAPATLTRAPATATYTRTATPNPKFSATPTTTNTSAPTATNTNTATTAPTSTWTPIPTTTRAATLTPVATATNVPLPSNTAVINTATTTPSSTPALFGKDTVRIGDVAPSMLQRILQHVADHPKSQSNPHGFDIANFYVGNDAIPFYRPDVNTGKTPAYYEFALFSDNKFTKPTGYIIVSAGPHDYPIAHWDSKGVAISRQLLSTIKYDTTQPIKLWKLDTLSYAAEQNNNIISQIGNIPTLINGLTLSEFNTYTATTKLHAYTWVPTDARVVDDDMTDAEEKANPNTSYVKGSEIHSGPSEAELKQLWSYDTLTAMPWSTYQIRYRSSFAPLINSLTQQASRHWGIEQRLYPAANQYSVPVAENDIYYFVVPKNNLHTNNGSILYSINDLDATIALSLESKPLSGYPVFKIIAQAGKANKRPALVTVYSNEGGTWVYHRIKIQVISEKSPYSSDDTRMTTRGWSSWNTFYTQGNDASQRAYNQFTDGLSCLSGCGPTAWMMLFGWADFLSSYGATGTTLPPGTQIWRRAGAFRTGGVHSGSSSGVAPATLDTAVKTTIYNVRNRVNTFCSFGSGATAPWDMDGASGYLSEMRTGLGMTVHYNAVGYHEDRLRDYAKAQIINNQRPVIIGTGWLTHYPVAYRYKWRSRPEEWDEGWFDGNDVFYQREFYVNQGWGGSGNGWVNAGTWFAGRIYP